MLKQTNNKDIYRGGVTSSSSPPIVTVPSEVTARFSQLEQLRKLRLLKIFCYVLTGVALYNVLVTSSLYLAGRINEGFILLAFQIIFFLVVTLTSWLVATRLTTTRTNFARYFRLTSQIVVGSMLGEISLYLVEYGVNSAIPLGFIICITVAALLLPIWEVLLVTIVSLVLILGFYIVQNMAHLFIPPLLATSTSLDSLNLTTYTVVIGLFALLMIVPARGYARLQTLQTWELEALVQQLLSQETLNNQLSRKIQLTSTDLANKSSQQISGSQTQLFSISQLLSFMRELTQVASSIQERGVVIANSLEEVIQATKRINGLVRAVEVNSRATFDKAQSIVIANETVDRAYQQFLNRLADLGDQTNQIGEVTSLIKELGIELHLIGLNALLEAAGVEGGAGERFRVVAQEVKSLSDSTTAGSKRIAEILLQVSTTNQKIFGEAQEIRKGMEEALTAAQATRQLMTTLAENVSVVKAEIDQVEQGVLEVGEVSQEVSGSSKVQEQYSQEALTALETIGVVASQSLALSAEVAAMAGALNKLSQQLLSEGVSFPVSPFDDVTGLKSDLFTAKNKSLNLTQY